jgi:Recombination endonuclease VII
MTIHSRICQAPNCENPRDIKQRSSLCVMHRVRRSRYKSFDLPLKIKDNLPPGIVKICKIHGELTEKQIYYNPSGKYCWPQCIMCKKVSNTKFLKKCPSRHRNEFQKKRYEELFFLQEGRCAICKKPETSRSTNSSRSKETKRLAIDHCHESEKAGIFKIRGLLCHFCNVSLGGFKDSIETLESAIIYLKSHEAKE